MKKKKIWLKTLTIASVALLLSSCSNSENSQKQIDDSNTNWSTDDVFQQAIGLETVKSWGYFDNSSSDKTEIVDFKESAELIDSQLQSVKPSECLPLAVLLEDSPDSGARFMLKQNHSDSDVFPSKSMMFRIFAYDSEDQAKKVFEAAKSLANKCGNYMAQFKDEVYTRDLWDGAQEVGDNLVQAFNSEYDEANALGREGSAIYYLYFLNFEKMEKSKSDLQQAIALVRGNLVK
jgi:hypothetical protein